MKNYKSVEEVKNELAISDFNNISNEKITEFIRMIPKIDKEVALAVIKQIPDYIKMTKEMVGELTSLCKDALQGAEKGRDETIKAYMTVLSRLDKRLEDNNLSKKEYDETVNEMLEIAQKIDATNDKYNSFIEGIVKKAVGFAAGALTITAGIAIVILGGSKNNNGK